MRPTIASADWFQKPEVQRLYGALNRDGVETRAVGGAVRNALMGKPVTEVDFATTATPEEIVELAHESGFKTVPTGIAHGTVTVIVDEVPFEVTTLRRDVETYGRHAVVEFGSDWVDDAMRRDFTINALYADAAGRVHDPLGGLPDLYAQRVRFVGDAALRIREDYLRILRFFRFSADYAAGEFDATGVAACVAEKEGVRHLSRERVRSELVRILLARRSECALAIMAKGSILTLILQGEANVQRFQRLACAEKKLGIQLDPMRRLYALAISAQPDVVCLSNALRLSGKETAQLNALFATPQIKADIATDELAKALYRHGNEAVTGQLLLSLAETDANTPDIASASKVLDKITLWQKPSFPVQGVDLLTLGYGQGPLLGKMLRELEERWIESGFRATREGLLAQARAALEADK